MVIAMDINAFRKAQNIEKKIKDINHIITGLDQQSFYTVALLNAGNDRTQELSEYLGREYMVKANRDLVDALKLKRMDLQEQFSRYVTT